jgi:uncharacterized protein YbjT (DUF2867 family)
MENLAERAVASSIARDRVVAFPVPADTRVAWLAAADLGAYAGAALRRPDLVGRTLDIGGPGALDGPALARELSADSKRPLQYRAVPPAGIEQRLAAQLGPAVARDIARSYAWLAEHPDTMMLAGTSSELAGELRRRPLSVREWSRANGLVT